MERKQITSFRQLYNEQFKELNRANKNNDYGTMLEMAEELGIGIKDNEESYLNNTKQIRAIIKSITDMQTTLAWQWVHTEKNQKDAYRTYILEQMKL